MIAFYLKGQFTQETLSAQYKASQIEGEIELLIEDAVHALGNLQDQKANEESKDHRSQQIDGESVTGKNAEHRKGEEEPG